MNVSNLKAFADHNCGLNDEKSSPKAKNIVGKGENAGYQHFLLFPQCF